MARDFTQDPRYQRALHRLRRMSPEQQAVFSSLSLDEAFADKEMRKKVKSMQLATAKESRKASVELGKRGLDLKRRRLEFQKSQILPATLVGIAQVGLGVYGGIERRKTAIVQRETAQTLARFYLSQGEQPTAPGPAPYQAPGWTRGTLGSAPSSVSGWTRRTPRRTRSYWGQ